MEYGDLLQTEVIISHKANLNGIREIKVKDKSRVQWLVVG